VGTQAHVRQVQIAPSEERLRPDASFAISTRSRAWTARARYGRAAAGRSRKYLSSHVWTVGVDTAKNALYSKLKVTALGPGYCHFPDSYQQEYSNQLTREQVRTSFVRGHPVRYWFKPSGVRNEALDRRVYAITALHARPVPWEVLLRAAPTEPPPGPRSSPDESGPSGPASISSLPALASRFERRNPL
jgi:phage terminase large subunit GpA-like protein